MKFQYIGEIYGRTKSYFQLVQFRKKSQCLKASKCPENYQKQQNYVPKLFSLPLDEIKIFSDLMH